MYLERVKAKGRSYLYLKQYDGSMDYSSNKKRTVYRFGRLDRAVSTMKEWERDFQKFPNELIEVGCTRRDLSSWLKNLKEKTTNEPPSST